MLDRREDVGRGEGRHLVDSRARAGVGPRRPQRGARFGEGDVEVVGDGLTLYELKVAMPVTHICTTEAAFEDVQGSVSYRTIKAVDEACNGRKLQGMP